MERLVHIDLFGQDFSFYTDASDEDLENILALVRNELQEEGLGTRTSLPSNKMLLLSCLKLAAKYVQLEKEFKTFRQKQDASIDKLISKVSSEME